VLNRLEDQFAGAPLVAVTELAEYLQATTLRLAADGAPEMPPLAFVDLSRTTSSDAVDAADAAADRAGALLVGVAPDGVPPMYNRLVQTLTCTLSPMASRSRAEILSADLTAEMSRLASAVAACPRAAFTLGNLLRTTARLPVYQGLVTESATYSMLLAGAEFRRWRAMRPVRPIPDYDEPAIVVTRDDSTLVVTINRPQRRNAFGREVRDGLIEAFDLAVLDRTITAVRFTGAGPAFCSGGDLDEFGTADDVTTAHLTRLDRSVAMRVHRCRDRVTATLHGGCIGAGVEIPAFADRVLARDNAIFQLPELEMGLVPGAGGTVGITARIGRWRTAYLALSGERIGVDTALEWGLVDERVRD
jgi:hypothetical protein